MAQLLATLLPYIITGMLVLGAVLFLISLQQLRRGRTGPYWRLRRQAGQRGGQLFLISLALFGVAFALAFFSGLADLALAAILSRSRGGLQGVIIPTITMTSPFTATPTSTATEDAPATESAILTLTAMRPTDTATPTITPTSTASPTITLTPTVTPTPTATFERVLNLTPMESPREPQRNALIELYATSAEVAPDQTPVNPTDRFEAGIQRIYLFIHYDNMDSGVAWTRILYREGVPIQGQSYLWSLGETGDSFFFFGDDEGYPEGRYEARIFLGTEEVSSLPFIIEAAP